MPRYYSGAQAQAEAMKAAWVATGGSLEGLTLDAFEVLEKRTDLEVLRVPEFVPRDSELGCSVAGGYRHTPPTLVVTESMSWRRQQFTLLHELGHHLQRTTVSLGKTVLRQQDRAGFEDAACDTFAASILLPDDMVDEASIPFGGPSARTAVDLFESSNASRAAISVRMSGRLRGAGAVAVVNEAGVVTFAAARGSIFAPARLSDQSENPLIRAALEDRDPTRVWSRDDARIWYSSGHSSNELYGQAAWAGDRLFVVMVEESAPWRSYSPPREKTSLQRKSRWATCNTCAKSFEVHRLCLKCSKPKCPSDHCGCTAQTLFEKMCDSCTFVKHTSQFTEGSAVCKECE